MEALGWSGTFGQHRAADASEFTGWRLRHEDSGDARQRQFLSHEGGEDTGTVRHEGGFSHRSGIPQVRLGGLAVLGLAPQDRWRVRSGACCRYRVVPVDPAVKEERIVRLLCLCQHHFLRKTVDSL